MTLRVSPIFTGLVLAAMAFFAITVLFVRPALAQDIYTITDIHVDAVGASSTEAANAAILQGRPKAFQILFRRLTRQQDWGREPALDGAGLVRLSRGYTVAMSGAPPPAMSRM